MTFKNQLYLIIRQTISIFQACLYIQCTLAVPIVFSTYYEAKIRQNLPLILIIFAHLGFYSFALLSFLYNLLHLKLPVVYSKKILFNMLKNLTIFFLPRNNCHLSSAFYHAFIISCLDWCKKFCNDCSASVLLPFKPSLTLVPERVL